MRAQSTIRRKAARDGYVIRTYRSGYEVGLLLIADASTTGVVAGWEGSAMDWDEVEAWLYDCEQVAA
jgi:hypothetical protein